VVAYRAEVGGARGPVDPLHTPGAPRQAPSHHLPPPPHFASGRLAGLARGGVSSANRRSASSRSRSSAAPIARWGAWGM